MTNWMEHSDGLANDAKSDWAVVLPPQVFASVILWLRAALPPPVVDKPGEWLARDRVAMAAVASLAPVSAAEVRLAAQFVAADAYGMDCLRLAQAFRSEPEVARQCAAQALAMMRQSQSAMRTLLRVQAVRGRMSGSAARQAEWVEHVAVSLMGEALAAAPAVVPAAARRAATALDVRNVRQMSDAEIEAVLSSVETMTGLDGLAAPAASWMAGEPLLPASSHLGRR